jgi:hypothetical protein
MHVASFPLHDGDGDFGAAATGRMRPGDGFVALVEYLPGDQLRPAVGLFEHRGVPTAPGPEDFRPNQLEVTRAGQLGWQRFFTASGRPCCLYGVIRPGTAGPGPTVTALGRTIATIRLAS